jgi:hypothetical protein
MRWQRICRSKRKGCLGIKSLRKTNISLLCKWRWLLESEEGLWQNIVKIKYGRGSPICLIIYKGVEELRSTMGIGLVSGLMLGWWTFFVSSSNTLCYGNFNKSH